MKKNILLMCNFIPFIGIFVSYFTHNQWDNYKSSLFAIYHGLTSTFIALMIVHIFFIPIFNF